MAIISAVRPRQGRAAPRSHNCRFKSTPILHRNSSLMNSAKSAREGGGNDLPDSSSLPIWDVWNARRGGKLARNGNTSSRSNLGGRKKKWNASWKPLDDGAAGAPVAIVFRGGSLLQRLIYSWIPQTVLPPTLGTGGVYLASNYVNFFSMWRNLESTLSGMSRIAGDARRDAGRGT